MEAMTNKLIELVTDTKAKVTVFNALEVIYGKDGLEFKGAVKKGNVKITIDEHGNVRSSAKMGSFSIAKSDVAALGANFKSLEVIFSQNGDGTTRYRVTVKMHNALSFQFEDNFRIEDVLFSDGYLGRTYDAMKKREREQKEVINELQNR